MTRVSIASLRVSNPSVGITVVCDAVSGGALRCSCDPLLDEADDVIICETPGGDAGYRNRHVKTRLRETIEGPFLFLDSDTFVRGDLSPIFSLDADIAGARNHSQDEFCEQIWKSDAETLAAMRWRVREQAYINGGVLFCSDTPATHRFASIWHHKWLDSVKKCAKHRDQPALNTALLEGQLHLEILPHEYNAQVNIALHVAWDAVVWHFYATSPSKVPMTTFEVLVDRVLRGERLCLDTVVQIIQRPHPWRGASWLDDRMAKGLAYKGRLDPGYNAWFQGRRIDAWRYWTVNALKGHSVRLRQVLKRMLSWLNRCRLQTN